MKLIITKGTFHGIYEWSVGFVGGNAIDTFHKWNNYWLSLDAIFWHHFSTDDCQYLVGTGGSIFLHPKDFTLVLHKIGGSYRRDEKGNEYEIFPEIEELDKICSKCAEVCGGTFEMSPLKIVEV